MINLETFKKIVEDIQKHNETNDKLAKLINADYIGLGDSLVTNLINIVQKSMKNGYDTLDWWLYEAPKTKRVYEEINDKETIVYDLRELEDLYCYMNGDFHKVEQELVKTENLNITKTQYIQANDVEELFTKLGIEKDE